MQSPNYIEPLGGGEERDLVQVLNEIIYALNPILAMRGTNGIRIYKSDNATVIDGYHISGSGITNIFTGSIVSGSATGSFFTTVVGDVWL